MALTTINITQGAGTAVEVDSSGAGYMQVIKLAESVLGSTALLPASAVTGLLVNVGTPAVSQSGVWNVGAVTSITNTVTVAGAVSITGAPAVTQSGAWVITSITNTVTVAGAVSITGVPAVSQSGVWNIGTVTGITNPVTVAGTVAISGTVPVSGTVTGNQGSAAAIGSAWYVRVSDGALAAVLQPIGGINCLPVKVLGQVGGGYSQVDKTAFVEGTTPVEVIGGVFNDAFVGSPAAGQASVLRITAQRAVHINLRNVAGTEIGTAAAAVRVDPVGTTPQPVNISDSGGVAISAANPLHVAPSLNPGTQWRQHVTFGASATALVVHTPAAGKTVYVKGLTITPTAAGAIVKLFDNADSDTAELFNGQPPLGSWSVVFQPPEALSAANNVLKYSTGAAAAGDFLVWGYDA
jgi:hypothetical protein